MATSNENQTVLDNLNTNGTTKEAFVATTEGMLLSYSFLLIAALLCVYFGSYRSVSRKDSQKKSGEKPDVLTAKDGKSYVSSWLSVYVDFSFQLPCSLLLQVDFYLESI